MTTLYVKKVWSWNPTKYEYITLEKAYEGYHEYCKAVLGSSQYYNGTDYSIKSFKQWLTTEI